MINMIKKAILYSLCCLTLLIAAIFLTGCRSKAIDTASSESDTTDKSPLASIAGTWREDSENGIKVLIVSHDGSYLFLNEVGATLKGSVKREQADGGKLQVQPSLFLFASDLGLIVVFLLYPDV